MTMLEVKLRKRKRWEGKDQSLFLSGVSWQMDLQQWMLSGW